jgi:hypothetical protein
MIFLISCFLINFSSFKDQKLNTKIYFRMVNQSALYKLSKLNDEINKNMKPWNERSRYDSEGRLTVQLKKMKKQIRNILNAVSGNNITIMLKGKN